MAIRVEQGLLWRLQLNHTLHAQICQNQFYFCNRGTCPDDDDTLAGRANALISSFEIRILNDILQFWNNQVGLNSIIATTVVPHLGPIAEKIYNATTGFQVNESLPGYCAAILSLRSGFGGRSYRGRVYFTGISEDDSGAGRLGVDSFNILDTIGDKLIANYGPVGSDSLFKFVIYSRTIGPGIIEDGRIAGVIPVVQCLPRSILGTQRHRLIGHGT